MWGEQVRARQLGKLSSSVVPLLPPSRLIPAQIERMTKTELEAKTPRNPARQVIMKIYNDRENNINPYCYCLHSPKSRWYRVLFSEQCQAQTYGQASLGPADEESPRSAQVKFRFLRGNVLQRPALALLVCSHEYRGRLRQKMATAKAPTTEWKVRFRAKANENETENVQMLMGMGAVGFISLGYRATILAPLTGHLTQICSCDENSLGRYPSRRK